MSEPSMPSSDSSQAVDSPLSKSRRLLIVGAVIVALVAVGAVVKTSGGVGGSRSGTIASSFGENSRLAAGAEHVCTIRADSTVWCWGDNTLGELGGNAGRRVTPVQVPTSDVSDARSLASGYDHTCALLNDGHVKCWGNNSHGETNPSTARNFSQGPSFVTEVSGTGGPNVPLANVNAISAGGDHTCALMSDRSVMCWGYGAYGALGNGESEDSWVAVFVHKSVTDDSNLVDVASLAVGGDHTCILNTSGKASCWGANFFGQLGNNPSLGTTLISHKKAPVEVDSDEEFSTIATSANRTCAILKSTKALQCWGLNYSGQVGDGTRINRQQPVNVSGDGNYNVELALGKAFSCSLASTEAIRCWGNNSEGQLGNGTTDDRNTAGFVIFP